MLPVLGVCSGHVSDTAFVWVKVRSSVIHRPGRPNHLATPGSMNIPFLRLFRGIVQGHFREFGTI